MREAYPDPARRPARGAGGHVTSVGTGHAESHGRRCLNADLALAEEVISEDLRVDDLPTKPRNVPSRCSPAARGHRSAGRGVDHPRRRRPWSEWRPCAARARASRRRHPASVLPRRDQADFAEMGKVGCELGEQGGAGDPGARCGAGPGGRVDDDAMDDLHRHMFTVMMGREWPHGVATAVDVTLPGPVSASATAITRSRWLAGWST